MGQFGAARDAVSLARGVAPSRPRAACAAPFGAAVSTAAIALQLRATRASRDTDVRVAGHGRARRRTRTRASRDPDARFAGHRRDGVGVPRAAFGTIALPTRTGGRCAIRLG
ncbi:MAG: hypothetical protein ABS52_13085 [Gemmatimonadetes bacterium SCN 70-22]|nr:MAG: hypothetical protein ABS52_13085 [Gemmatimonadetes bacterium SCN 70-22]